MGDKQVSDTAMAKKIGCSRKTIWEWRLDGEFRRWLHQMLTGDHEHDWELVLASHHKLAIRGSVRSAEFLGRVRSVGMKGGGFEPGAENIDNSVTNYTVISMVPRPPALPEKTVGGGPA